MADEHRFSQCGCEYNKTEFTEIHALAWEDLGTVEGWNKEIVSCYCVRV